MKLIALQAESFKRLRAVRINPGDGVTPIVGRNGAGKTSVIDAVASALGGAACAPAMPIRRGEQAAEVTVDLGDIKVRRRWTAKGSSLEVYSPDGAKYPSPQAVLDKLIGKLSFDPLEFSRLPAAQQAKMLAGFAGVDLDDYAAKRKGIFDERTGVNRQAKASRAQLDAMPVVDAPDAPVDIAALITKIRDGQAANAAAEKANATADAKRAQWSENNARIRQLENELAAANTLAEKQRDELTRLQEQANAASNAMVDVAPWLEEARQAESVNDRIRSAKARSEKAAAVALLEKQANDLTARLDKAEKWFGEKIAAAQLPVDGLAVSADGVTLNGIPFSDCSGAEKLRASVAVAIALNPQLKLMLIRDGSLLDSEGMALLASMAEAADAQVLIERVDNGNEVGVRIVDGEVEESAAVSESGV